MRIPNGIARKALVIAALTLALALGVTAVADAGCGCRRFAQAYVDHPKAILYGDLVMDQYGVAERTKRRIKLRIYDYARQGPFKQSWCDRHPKLRRKLRNCLIAGGVAYLTSRASGANREDAAVNGAGACAVAVATTP